MTRSPGATGGAGALASRDSGRRAAIDRHVGARIRERRVVLGLTQRAFARLIGVSLPQAYKYEAGIDRIFAGRLFGIARALGVDLAHFFEGLDGAPAAGRDPRRRRLLELARSFAAIADPRRREALCALARAMAGVQPETEEGRPDIDG